jgi:hypothetical protein
MDITKLKAAIAAAKVEVNNVVNDEIKARSFGALKALAGVETSLTRTEEKLEGALKRTQPRVKKAKKGKKAGAATA